MARPQTTSSWISAGRARDRLRFVSERYPTYLALGLLAVLGVVLVWTRFEHITDGLWHDEAYSVLNHNGLTDAFGGHVLFNQLSWATTSVIGESEVTHRLWSVVPGTAAIGFGAWWSWHRMNAATAVAFAALAVATPLHLEFVPDARGYGLSVLAATLMLIAADRLTRRYSTWGLVGFLAAGLAGILTLVFFAFSFVGQVVSLLRWAHLRLAALGTLAVAGIVSFIYLDPAANYGQVGGETISLGGALLLDRTIDWLVVPTALLLGGERGLFIFEDPVAAPWIGLLGLALIVVAIVALWRREDGGLALLLVLPPVFFNLAFSVAELNTTARHQLVLLPHVLFLVAIGIAELGRLIARVNVLKPAVLAVGAIVVLGLSRAIVYEEDTRALPRERHDDVAEIARDAGVKPIVTDSARPEGLIYYLGDELTVLPSEEVEEMLCGRRDEMVYIHQPFPAPSHVARDCLVGTNAKRIRVRQLTRGDHMDVWIVGPRAHR